MTGLRKISRRAYLQRSILSYLWAHAAGRAFITAEQIRDTIGGERSASTIGQAAGAMRGWVESSMGRGGGYRISQAAIDAVGTRPAESMARMGLSA